MSRQLRTRAWRPAAATMALTLLTACGSAPDSTPEPVTGPSIDRMVALSDGDHLASTYADGVLAPVEAGHRDLLSTVSIVDGAVTTAEVEVSNSVTAAPEVLALSPDGDTAFVAERLGQRGPGDTQAAQLRPANRLFAVDVTDLAAPVVSGVVGIADSPEALAVHPDGSAVATVSNDANASVLQIIPFGPEGFGTPATTNLAEIGITGDEAGPGGGVVVTNVQWHPGGRMLAVNVDSQNRVAFLTVAPEGRLTPWGVPVTTGTDPFVGRFTPDGKHYLTSDWGRDLAATTLATRLPAQRSRLTVIEVGQAGERPEHRVVANAETDESAEGLAVSPDGQWVATVNMRGTALPEDHARHDDSASISLLRRDASTGTLTKVGDYELSGVLPEGGSFDRSGRYFIATVFQGGAEGAGLQILGVGPADDPGLSPVQFVPLPHGVHHVAVG